jgi:hypothetical protein
MESPSISKEAPVHIQFKLANAWQIQGNFEEAFQRYQEVLSLQPDYMPAYQQLGNLMLRQRRMEEALEYYDRSLALDFEATNLSFYYRCLGLPDQKEQASAKSENIAFWEDAAAAEVLQKSGPGKINLARQRVFGFHRSGWSYAIQALSPLHNPEGILFDGFLEHQFLFQHARSGQRSPRILEKMKGDGVFQHLATSEEKGITPYQEPWIGFLHNPQGMPVWFNYHNSPQKLFEKQIWQDSLPHCLGLFALSEYHATWMRQQTGKPVSVLVHPTEIPQRQFEFNQFLANPAKKIVQIGWWLRKLNSLYRLPIARGNLLGYEKVRLGFLPGFSDDYVTSFMKLEARLYKFEIDSAYLENTSVVQHLPNQEYDDLLARNIAFVELYDSSANNAIIECIARATPLLVNPLPAVKEYLGEDYPMYFNSLEEAADKAMNTELILETHQYLKNCEIRGKLSADYFLKSFRESEVYKLI